MNIITHVMTGVTIATPLAVQRPLTAAAIVFGSLLPDLDVLSRCWGKKAFLRFHQTLTHSLPCIAVMTLAMTGAWHWMGWPELWAPAALGAGMMIHSLMDFANTYGTTIMWPFVRRRVALNWMFFTDAVTVAVTTTLGTACIYSALHEGFSALPAVIFAIFIAGWWTLRAVLARRARELAITPGDSLVPGSWWHFYGCHVDAGGLAELYLINAINGTRRTRGRCLTMDEQYAPLLASVPEYVMMRSLSSEYHVVEAQPCSEGLKLICRDLRTQNFGGRFGQLTVTLDRMGNVQRKVFDV
ncbi:MAG: metal-dependent hydrolase [Planctomycetaceae bacterium]|nr:metal-dependent hydrolase [Planctomycetaceae bacterium]